MGEVIANILIIPKQKTAINPLKAYILSQKFYSDDEVEINEVDIESIKKEIEEDKGASGYSYIVTGQILQKLNQVK